MAANRRDSDQDRDERIVELAALWIPYGGVPSTNIIDDFGMSPVEFFRRLHSLLTESAGTVDLDSSTVNAMLAVCNRRHVELTKPRGEHFGRRVGLSTGGRPRCSSVGLSLSVKMSH